MLAMYRERRSKLLFAQGLRVKPDGENGHSVFGGLLKDSKESTSRAVMLVSRERLQQRRLSTSIRTACQEISAVT